MERIFNDNESNIDYLGYENYINVFKYIVDSKENLIKPPIVFGIHGEWGIGKSTFINLLSNELMVNYNNIIIKLNPWENRNSDNIEKIFFIELYKKLKEKSLIEKSKDFIDKLFELVYPLKFDFNIGLAKCGYDVSKIKDIEKKRMLENYIDTEYSFKDKIKKLLRNDIFNNYNIIVFIDDLDRCSVDKVIETLEAIKLFLNTERCIFFIGCDINYLNCAVAKYYNDFINFDDDYGDKNILKFTREYLEKIIQVPFNIPIIDKESMKNYIKSILKNTKQNNNFTYIENNLKESSKDIYNILNNDLIVNLFYSKEVNPRRIKRLLNIIYINYLFLLVKLGDVNSSDIEILSLLTIVGYENPLFYRNNLSESIRAKDIIKKIFNKYKEDLEENLEEVEINDIEDDIKYLNESTENLFYIYFKNSKVKNIHELDRKLINIQNIITVNNTTSIAGEKSYELNEIENIKSVTKTKRKMSSFLECIKGDELAENFISWFLNEIFINGYKNNKLVVGIYSNNNIIVFKNKIENNNFKDNFLLKINYDDKYNEIKIYLKTTKYESNFKKYNKDKDIIIYKKENEEEIKQYIKELFEGELKDEK